MKRFYFICIGVLILWILVACNRPPRMTYMMRIDREIEQIALRYKIQARERYVCADHAITLP